MDDAGQTVWIQNPGMVLIFILLIYHSMVGTHTFSEQLSANPVLFILNLVWTYNKKIKNFDLRTKQS